MTTSATAIRGLFQRIPGQTKIAITVAAMTALSGCVTLSGDYEITAVGTDGQPVASNMKMTAHGSGIYTFINAICSAHPGATVYVRDIKTGEELKSESPKKCR
jgi:hypothetical protein